MDWTIVGSLAGIFGAAAAIVLGLIPLVRECSIRCSGQADAVAGQELRGLLLPAPVLDAATGDARLAPGKQNMPSRN